MHRFLKFQPFGNTRVGLRADGSIWLIANHEESFEVCRSSDWLKVLRLRLCDGDRVRIQGNEEKLLHLCGLVGVVQPALLSVTGKDAALSSNIPDIKSPRPLSAPAEVIDNARRDPGTGQVGPGRFSEST
ncbi:MAG TPA: hypothetical protein VJ984_07650 [Xanthomonadales bacterium]|nr:hypothetical protein [Xanthomonadales bacterium]